VSGTFQSVPGPELAANLTVLNAAIVPSLGRPLSGNRPNVTLNVIPPGAMYGDRQSQLDLRVGKLFTYGSARTSINLDVYNALNSDAVVVENSAYGRFRQPLRTAVARFAKITVQFDF
jgi:hypothetical protein